MPCKYPWGQITLYAVMQRLSTHWGQVTHTCVSKLTIICSDNGLSPHRRQSIIWTNAGILLTGPLGTNFSEILIEIHIFSYKKMHLKMSSENRRPFCLFCLSFYRVYPGKYGLFTFPYLSESSRCDGFRNVTVVSSTVCSTVCSDADQRKHQSSASLAFVREFTGDRWIPRTKGQ